MRGIIKATAANRKELRAHAREAMADYSPVMTWLIVDEDGDLYTIEEPQGQTSYVGGDEIIATTGGFYKAHGDGAARDQYGQKYRTQRDYLIALLGLAEYQRIFVK
ncbi:MAG: hypothetical protein LBQ81_11220 [Zoogloeaceae bacterium]|jgi:hypothetical protein|nr:hypothetical protein [Zoogloeaceae bacterium]